MTEPLHEAARAGELARMALLLGVLLLVGEAMVPGFGALGVAGLACLVLAALLVFAPGFVLAYPWATAAALVALVVAGLLLVGRLFAADRRRPARTGLEGMVGERGVARSVLDPSGTVLVRGEIWRAHASVRIEEGAALRVVAVDGLELKVEPAEPQGERP